MQRLVLGITMVLCAGLSSAQDLTFSHTTQVSSPLYLTATREVVPGKAMPRGLRMRNTGRALTIAGGALAIGGIVMMNNADQLFYRTTSTQNGTVTEGDPKGALGVLMTITGVGMMVPGVIFWSKGQKKYNRYLEQQNASLNLKLSGLSLTYSF
jgi:hypothetical protein